MAKRDELDGRIEALRGSVRTRITVIGGVNWQGTAAEVKEDLRSKMCWHPPRLRGARD
jgi:hypothetical protein